MPPSLWMASTTTSAQVCVFKDAINVESLLQMIIKELKQQQPVHWSPSTGGDAARPMVKDSIVV